MNRVLERGAGAIVAWRRAIVVLTLLVSAPFVYWSLALFETENSLSIWFPPGDPKMAGYEHFQATFGSDEFFVVAFESDDVYSAETLARIEAISADLERVEAGGQPVRVLSLTRLPDAFGEVGPAHVAPLPFDRRHLVEDEAQRARFRAWVESIRPVSGTFVDREGRTTTILGMVPRLEIAGKRALEDDLRAALARHEDSGRTLHLGGTPVLDAEFDRHTQRDTLVFLPVGFTAIVLVLVGVFRRPGPVLLCTVVIVVSTCVAIGIFNLRGNHFNISTGLLPPLILAISVADAVHIVTHYQEELVRGKKKDDALRETIVRMFWPCFYTSLTTAIGFASFLFMDVVPIQQVGLYTGVGIAVAFVLSFTFLPAALHALPVPVRPAAGEGLSLRARFLASRALDGLATFNDRRRHLVLAGCVPVAFFAAWGVSRLDPQTYGVAFFQEEVPLRRAYEFIETRMGGVSTLEFIIEGEPGAFHSDEALAAFRDFDAEFRKGPVTDVVSTADFVCLANQALAGWDPAAYQLPGDGRAGVLLRLVAAHPGSQARRYLTADGSAAHVTVRIEAIGTRDAIRLMKRMEAWLEARFPAPAHRTELTGIVPMYIQMDQILLNSQIKSFAAAFAVISILMTIQVRSLRLGLIAMVPNILPVALTFGLMGFLGIPLDVATIMVAGAALGIAVDDTIHYLSRFRHELEATGDYLEAMHVCNRTVGRAMLSTSVILLVAFGTLVFGSFNPTVALGGLTALTMVFAVVGDLVLLPVLLIVFRPLRVARTEVPRSADLVASREP